MKKIMKKRFWSMIMALVMILTVIPVQPVQASGTETISLGYSHYQWNPETGEYLEAPDATIFNELDASATISQDVFMYYTDGSQKVKLSVEDVTSSDESILQITKSDMRDDLIRLVPLAVGETTIDCVINGQVHSMKVTVDLPELGFYKEPVASAENLIREFEATETADTFYAVCRNNTIKSFMMYDNLNQIATASLSDDSKYITITVTGKPNKDWWYAIYATLETPDGFIYDTSQEIVLNNGMPVLMMGWPDWSSGVPSYKENAITQNQVNVIKWLTSEIYIVLDVNGAKQRLTAADLVSSDESIFKVYADEKYPEVTVIEGMKCGTATLSYTYIDGTGASKTVGMDVNVILPHHGFYTEPTATENTYITDFTITEEQDTIYLVSRDGAIDQVELQGGWIGKAIVSISEDKTYATINVADVSTHKSNGARVILTSPLGSTFDNYCWISLTNTKPELLFSWPVRDENNIPGFNPDKAVNSGLTISMGYGSSICAVLVEDGSKQVVQVGDLVSSDESIVKISALKNNPDVTIVEGIMCGKATLSYTYTDDAGVSKTVSMDVEVILPDIGFYREATATAATYIKEFDITETQDTIYLVANNCTIERIELEDNWAGKAVATISQDKTYATINVAEVPTGNVNRARVTLKDARNNVFDAYATISLTNAKPALAISWPAYDDTSAPYYDPQRVVYNSINMAMGYTSNVCVVYVEGGIKQLVPVSKLVSSNENIVRISANNRNPDVAVLEGVNCGSTTVSYTYTDENGASKTLEFSVEVVLPAVGFYTESTASNSAYIKEFEITETQDTIYLVCTEGTIDNVELTGTWNGNASVTISQDKTYATINVADVTTNKNNSAKVSYTRQNGYSTYEYASISLISFKPALMYRYAGWTPDTGWTEDTSEMLHNKIDGNPNSNGMVFFYFTVNGTETKIPASMLHVGDDSVVAVHEWYEGSEGVAVECLGFGETTVSYTDPATNKTYSIDVKVDLPTIGYYTTTTASKDNYVSTFNVTETADTFYVVPLDGWTLTSVVPKREMVDVAEVELAADGSYATVKITGPFSENYWYYVEAQATMADGHYTYTDVGLRLKDSRPALKYRWADMSNDVPNENLSYDLGSILDLQLNQNEPVYFYYIVNGVETKLKASDLISSNENVVNVSMLDGSNVVIVNPVECGEAKLNYTVGGKTYSVDVKVSLPFAAAYKSTDLTRENYLPEFTVTEESNVVYLMLNAEESIQDVRLYDELGSIATAEVADDGSYAKLIITGAPTNQYYNFSLVTYNQYGNEMDYWGKIKLNNGKPFLALCWPVDDEGVEHGEYNYELYTAKGYATDVWVYLVEGDKETRLSAADLKDRHGKVLKITDCESGNGMVTLETIGWGDTLLIYTAGDKQYSMLVRSDIGTFGYYSKGSAHRDFWITEYTVTDTNNQFYFMATNGMKFDVVELTEDLDAVADIEMGPYNNSIKFTITGKPVIGGEYGIRFEASGPEGDTEGFHGIDLKREITEPEVEVGELPTVDPSKPVQNTVVGVDGEKAGEELADNANDVLTQIQDSMDDPDASAVKELEKKVSVEVIEVVLEALNQGADIKITPSVEATPVSSNQSETIQADVDKMKQNIGNGTVAQVLDLKVNMEVYVEGELAATGSMHELDEPVVFTAVLPEIAKYAIQNVPAGCELDLYVLYVHNGKVSKITDVTLNADGSISFPAKEFSTYALVYEHVAKAPEVIATTPMYRLYNPNSGEHFYTGSVEERDMLDAAGWNYEGVAWNAPISQGAPVHRVYNPNSGDHHYTMSQEEVDMLVGFGWQYEGVAWNSAPQDHPDAVPQYRLYNPNADCGSHHYTSSQEEMDMLTSVGWIYEGIGWYGLTK